MMISPSRPARTALFVVVLLAAACRKSAPEAPPQPKAPAGVIEVLKGGRWLFTYVEPAGTFGTTDKPESVPEGSRAVVRVFDPSDPAKTDLPGQVYVTDLNQLLKSGKAPAKPLSREAFETAALAQLPPGESSALAQHGAGAAPAEPPPPPLPADAGAPVVTIYGTSWCGACRSARQYLTQRRVPFADKDVERDPAAARELAEKAGKLGIPTDRVPIIEVRGRLLQGFDKARIDALLGEPT
jgi:glutaredoxin